MGKNTRTLITGIFLTAALLVSGQSMAGVLGPGGKVQDSKSDKYGLIYGRIKIKENKLFPFHVMIIRNGGISMGHGGITRTHTYSDGVFFLENAKKGYYAIKGFMNKANRYLEFPLSRKAFFKLQKGDITYAGLYTVEHKPTAKSFFTRKVGTFDHSYDNSEQIRIVKILIEKTKGTTWQPRLQAHLKELQSKQAKR